MKDLLGFAEDYNEYAEREQKSYTHLTDKKQRVVDYAKELKHSVIDKTIMFISNDGYGMGEIPKAILMMLDENPDFDDYKRIIFIRNKNRIKRMKREGFRGKHYHYELLQKGWSSEFYYWMARARYLIVDGELPSVYVPRKEQTYIQASFLYTGLFQGYQQSMRYTVRSMPYIKSFMAADYIISPSDLYTKEILCDAYRLKDSYTGGVVTCQFPVVEYLAGNTDKQICRKTGLRKKKSKKEVLVIGSEQHNAIEIARNLVQLSQDGSMKDYQFYYKPCQKGITTVIKWFQEREEENVRLVLEQADMLPWIQRCDVVVSDYNTNLFYAIDMEKPVVLLDIAGRQNLQTESMKKILHDNVLQANNREQLKQCIVDAKPAKRKAVEELFAGKENSSVILDILSGKEYPGEKLTKEEKERICFVVSMGHITKDVLGPWKQQLSIALKQMLQQGKDVSLFCDEPDSDSILTEIEQVVPHNVRVLYRIAERVMTEQEMIDSSYLIRNLAFSEDAKDSLSQVDMELNQRDLKRSIGNCQFDKVIFAGPFSAKFVILTKAMQAKQTMYWDQRNYAVLLKVAERTPKNQQRFENMIKIPECFDSVLHWDRGEWNCLSRSGMCIQPEKHFLWEDYLDYDFLLPHKEYEVATIHNQTYWMINAYSYLDGQKDFQFVQKCGESSSRYATHMSMSYIENIEDIMKAIRLLHEKNSHAVFYIFEDNQSCRKELELQCVNHKMEDYVVLCSDHFLWDILSEFSGFYSIEENGDIYERICEAYGVAYEKLNY